jgi:mRNA-degrading endonuclease HigB of HigAB toxin-antitoxin module
VTNPETPALIALPGEAFLTGQIAALDPFEFTVVAAVDGPRGKGPIEPRALVEIGHLEHGGYEVTVVPEGVTIAGFTERKATAPTPPEATTLALAALATLLPGETPRLAIIQGSKAAEVARQRKLAAVLTELNAWLNEVSDNQWGSPADLPLQFRFGNVLTRIGGVVDITGTALVELACLVAKEVPEDERIASLLVDANSSYSFGRLVVDDQQQVWFRQVLHADPVSRPALQHALAVAQQTTTEAAQVFAKLGAVDATGPEDGDEITDKKVNFGAYL